MTCRRVVRRAMVAGIVMGLTAGLYGQAQAPDTAAWRKKAEAALAARDDAGALAALQPLVEAVEADHVETLYLVAQAHARLGNREQTYLFLQRAIGAGFWNRARLRQDEAFAAYRADDLFVALTRKAWARGYYELLERANREEVQKSPAIMKALAFRPGERVADIGAGTGYFTFQVAAAVGPTGIVDALDIAPEMIEVLEFRSKARGATNVHVRRVAADDPQLAPGAYDTVMMVDAIHYVKDRTAYAKRLVPGLAPNGRLVIIDYRPKPMSERPWGPPPEQQFPREQLDREMAAAGLVPTASYDFLPEQFFVVYARAK